MLIMIWDVRQEYGNVLMISLPSYLTIIVVLSTYTTCSCVTAMLTSKYPNLYVIFWNSTSTSIARRTKTTLPYNFINLFNLLLRWYSIQLGIFLSVTKLSFLDNIIRNVVPPTNITSDVSIKNLCNFYEYIGIATY